MSPWISKIANALSFVIPVWVAWLIFLQAAYWFFGVAPEWTDLFARANAQPRDGYAWVGFASVVPVITLAAYGFYRLECFLLQFRQGQIFTLLATRHLRAYAFFMLVSILIEILTSGVYWWARGDADVSLASSWFKLVIGRGHIHFILLTGIFFIIAHALVEAVRLKDENEKFF